MSGVLLPNEWLWVNESGATHQVSSNFLQTPHKEPAHLNSLLSVEQCQCGTREQFHLSPVWTGVSLLYHGTTINRFGYINTSYPKSHFPSNIIVLSDKKKQKPRTNAWSTTVLLLPTFQRRDPLGADHWVSAPCAHKCSANVESSVLRDTGWGEPLHQSAQCNKPLVQWITKRSLPGQLHLKLPNVKHTSNTNQRYTKSLHFSLFAKAWTDLCNFWI